MNYLTTGTTKTQPKRKMRKTLRRQVYKANSQMKKGKVSVETKKNEAK